MTGVVFPGVPRGGGGDGVGSGTARVLFRGVASNVEELRSPEQEEAGNGDCRRLGIHYSSYETRYAYLSGLKCLLTMSIRAIKVQSVIESFNFSDKNTCTCIHAQLRTRFTSLKVLLTLALLST